MADVLGQVAAIAETRGFNLKEPLDLGGKRLDAASVAQYQQSNLQSPNHAQAPQSGCCTCSSLFISFSKVFFFSFLKLFSLPLYFLFLSC